jgi:hypothetical protein
MTDPPPWAATNLAGHLMGAIALPSGKKTLPPTTHLALFGQLSHRLKSELTDILQS